MTRWSQVLLPFSSEVASLTVFAVVFCILATQHLFSWFSQIISVSFYRILYLPHGWSLDQDIFFFSLLK